MIGRLVIASCALAAIADAQPAPPTPPPDAPPTKLDTSKLEALYASGTKHYNLAEWDAAIADFKQLYALMPDPSFLFNLGQAYRQKGNCREATAVYKSYLRTASDADRSRVEPLISELASCVKLEEENARRLLPPPPPPPATPRLLKLGGMIAAGTGLAVIGAGVAFGFRARGAAHDLEALCATSCGGSRVVELDQKGRESSRNAKILYITGGSIAAIGAAMFVYGVSRKERVRVVATPTGAMVATGGSF